MSLLFCCAELSCWLAVKCGHRCGSVATLSARHVQGQRSLKVRQSVLGAAAEGAELTHIPYGGNFEAGGGAGEAADARRALVTNAGLRRPRTPRMRARLALEALRRGVAHARGAVARVRRF